MADVVCDNGGFKVQALLREDPQGPAAVIAAFQEFAARRETAFGVELPPVLGGALLNAINAQTFDKDQLTELKAIAALAAEVFKEAAPRVSELGNPALGKRYGKYVDVLEACAKPRNQRQTAPNPFARPSSNLGDLQPVRFSG